jgi:hypothetical protein
MNTKTKNLFYVHVDRDGALSLIQALEQSSQSGRKVEGEGK